MSDALELSFRRADGHITLSCRACGDSHVEPRPQAGVVLAGTTATFLSAHAACRSTEGGPAPVGEVPPSRPARTRAVLVAAQLAGIDLLSTALADAAADADRGTSREERLDASRRLDVVRRQHEALLERLDGAGLSAAGAAPRVVVAHRNRWFCDKVAGALASSGAELVATTDNGADAVGIATAEQPDALLAEESLAMMTALDVLQDLRRLAPGTAVAVQVGSADAVPSVLAAGALRAWPRQIPPGDLAADLCALLQERSA